MELIHCHCDSSSYFSRYPGIYEALKNKLRVAQHKTARPIKSIALNNKELSS
jgi:hypothetical protein